MSTRTTVDEVKERSVDAAEKAAESPWFERMARWGLVARGVLYLVVALLAVQVAWGDDRERADKQGALQAVARQPLGRLLLVLLATGFAGYAAWRFVEAIAGPDEKDKHKAAAKRVLYVGRGALYVAFFLSAVKLLIWPDGESAAGTAGADWTARVLQWPAGTWLVSMVGIGIIGVGLYMGWRGVTCKFKERLDASDMSRAERRWVVGFGMVGMVARTVVIVLIGVFVVLAANEHRPDEAVGIDGALKRLASRPSGPALLTVVALGLAAYGIYSFAEARFRRIGDQ